MKRTDPLRSMLAKAKEKAGPVANYPTAEQIGRGVRDLFRDKDFYPVDWIWEDGKQKIVCTTCLNQRGRRSDGLTTLRRGPTVPCGCCGTQIPEPPIMPLEH
jgi:hypothetical protein